MMTASSSALYITSNSLTGVGAVDGGRLAWSGKSEPGGRRVAIGSAAAVAEGTSGIRLLGVGVGVERKADCSGGDEEEQR